MPPEAESIYGRLAQALQYDWNAIARPSQLPPPGAWHVWLLLAGRGFGKTRCGAEWVRGLVENGHAGRIALVAPTAADVRDVVIEGESGILAISPNHFRPIYEPSKRRLTWPNGAIGTAYSADESERLRGPQHDAAWCDELGSWRYPETWDMLMLGLRLGHDPRVCVTTTPKPSKIIRDLLAREGGDVRVTRGKTAENEANLAPAFLAQVVARYGGTRLGRQELDAEMLDDVPGALWSRDLIEQSRVATAPELRRVVVAIDPAVTSGEDSDETGIVVVGSDSRGHGYVLADLSGRYSPTEWARRAIGAYRSWGADRIVAEVNQGGAMVEATLRAVDPNVPFRAVHASRGKITRAEPCSALYEQGRIHHVGCFPALEDQMCSFSSDFDRAKAGYSPDHVDSLVWGLTELFGASSGAGWIEFYAREAAKARGEVLPPLPVPSQATLRPPPAPPPPVVLIAIKAPRPWMHFAPATGVQYCSDADCLIQAYPEHVKALKGGGCIIVKESA